MKSKRYPAPAANQHFKDDSAAGISYANQQAGDSTPPPWSVTTYAGTGMNRFLKSDRRNEQGHIDEGRDAATRGQRPEIGKSERLS